MYRSNEWNKFKKLFARLEKEWIQDITNYKSTGEITAVKKEALLPRMEFTYAAVTDELNVYSTYLEGLSTTIKHRKFNAANRFTSCWKSFLNISRVL
jgi:hypothetical protein